MLAWPILRFHDNASLTVGPKSSVRLDKFVYDPNKSAGGVAVEVTRGSFRFAEQRLLPGKDAVRYTWRTRLNNLSAVRRRALRATRLILGRQPALVARNLVEVQDGAASPDRRKGAVAGVSEKRNPTLDTCG